MPIIAKAPLITPLAAVLRPKTLNDVVGQIHLVGPGQPIRQMAEKRRAQNIILWGPPGTGKALALDTPLPNATGWTTIGAVQIGDQLFDENGHLCTVTFVTDIQLDRPCYRVCFDDGTNIIADAEHLWWTIPLRRTNQVVNVPGIQDQKRSDRWIFTTEYIANTIRVGAEQRCNHRIPVTGSLDLPNITLPIDPYIFGMWLGDGISAGSQLMVGDQDLEHVLSQLELSGLSARTKTRLRTCWSVSFGYRCSPYVLINKNIRRELRRLDVLHNKHIPIDYLRASDSQRLALLQGLMDTDGTCDKRGQAEFYNKNIRLINDVRELAHSLGLKTSLHKKKATKQGRSYPGHWRLNFIVSSSVPLFRLERKLIRQRELKSERSKQRYIIAVEPVPSVPVRCIQVDSPNHLYLAGESMTPTHNTTIVRALANDVDATFCPVNATDAKVSDLRTIISNAAKRLPAATFVFVDEIHRFSTSQQDVLLPVIEDGTITMFGATTERPKFAVNSTILSRCLVMETKPLDAAAVVGLLKRVKEHYAKCGRHIKIDADAAKRLIIQVNGDARKAIMALETAVEILSDDNHVTLAHINTAIPEKHVVFDARGNDHFDLAHAYQEAIQHSDVDAALYWLGKWVVSGEDPAYICRRMLITAFEDCAGNPFAPPLVMAACYATEHTGLPECLIPMAVATCEMAKSLRNKAPYFAISSVMQDLDNNVVVHVPPELRAGTAGYVPAISKQYLKGWQRDVETLRLEATTKKEWTPGRNGRQAAEGLVYAIGHPDNANGYGMMDGPTPHLQKMLDVVASVDGAHLLQFDGDDYKVLYEWRNNRWVPFTDAPQ